MASLLNAIGAVDLLEHLVGVTVLCLVSVRGRISFLLDGLQSEVNPNLSQVLEDYHLVAAANHEFDSAL